jgi:hypothetical protein
MLVAMGQSFLRPQRRSEFGERSMIDPLRQVTLLKVHRM